MSLRRVQDSSEYVYALAKHVTTNNSRALCFVGPAPSPQFNRAWLAIGHVDNQNHTLDSAGGWGAAAVYEFEKASRGDPRF